jgi:hypothetical protein
VITRIEIDRFKSFVDFGMDVRRAHPEDYFEDIGELADLDILAELPAYQGWLGEIESALRSINCIH